MICMILVKKSYYFVFSKIIVWPYYFFSGFDRQNLNHKALCAGGNAYSNLQRLFQLCFSKWKYVSSSKTFIFHELILYIDN